MRSSSSEDSGSADVDVAAAGKYHVLMELGRGGTAVVNAGVARGIGGFTKLVVLKAIKEDFLADRDAVRMFVNEARLSARMNHPNVVQVYEVYRQNRLPVIVMEYLDGQSLARVLPLAWKEPSYSTDLVIGILCKVLAGLQYAHSLADYDGTPLELVHRDVSPHNVMVTYDGQVKLVDFGIAKLSSNQHETKTGVIKGKIGYMAPEQVEGVPLDRRSDLFAIGVMLWEAVARRRMWGTRGDAEIVRGLVLDDVPSLANEPGVDPELVRISQRALAAQPDDRYSTAAELQADLEAYLQRRGANIRQQDIAELVCRICGDLRAISDERLQSELVKFAAEAPEWDGALSAFENLRTPPPSGSGRRRAVWLGGGLLLGAATLLAAFTWLEWQRGSTAAPEPAAPPVPALAQPADTPPHAPANVTLSVTASPAGASVFLDRELLSESPVSLSVPRDERNHELRVEAPGHAPFTRWVRLEQDLELTLELEPLAPPEPPEPPEEPIARSPGDRQRNPAEAPKRRPRPTPPPSAPVARPEPSPEPPRPAPPAAAPAADCDPPYFIGPDGIKQYRRECL